MPLEVLVRSNVGRGLFTENSPLLRDTPEYGAIATQHGEEEEIVRDESPNTKKLIWILGSVWFGTFLSALDTTVVATLSAPISNSFNSFTVVSWIASSYLISTAACQPLAGKLTDIFGRRAGLIVCNTFFLNGNLICGLARDEWVIIFGRAVAGMGGGGLNSIATFIVADLVPLRRRGLWQGIGNICWGIGSGLGGAYGGWVSDWMGWRWAFLIQVPLVAISMVLIWSAVDMPAKSQESVTKRLKQVDFLGSLVVVSSLVLLLVGLSVGGNTVPWGHPLVIASIVASAVLLVIFVYVENNIAPEPIIPVHLLLNRTVAAACLTNWLDTMAQYGVLYYGPIYFQVNGLSATQSGVRLIPQAVGVGIGSLGAGYIMRVTGRYYTLNVVTEGIKLAAFVAIFFVFTTGMPDWPPFVIYFLVGAGYVGALTITLLAITAAVDHKDQAVMTSASYACRSTGSSIGVTVVSAVFQNLLRRNLWEKFGDYPDAEHQIKRIRDSIDVIKEMSPEWYPGVMDSYMDALRGVWLTVIGLAALGMLASLFIKEHKLHTTQSRQ